MMNLFPIIVQINNTFYELLTLSTMKSIESAIPASTFDVVKLPIIIFFKTREGNIQNLERSNYVDTIEIK